MILAEGEYQSFVPEALLDERSRRELGQQRHKHDVDRAFVELAMKLARQAFDKTELDIGGGLNGIVGPNGCGKSNLVEALRWVMGENRARTMRGDGMEDVIFAGTSARPARNIAEVTLLIDNTDGSAPLPFG